jgi:hypothetical protein
MAAHRRGDKDDEGEPTIPATVGALLEAQAQAGQAAVLEVAAILKGVFSVRG